MQVSEAAGKLVQSLDAQATARTMAHVLSGALDAVGEGVICLSFDGTDESYCNEQAKGSSARLLAHGCSVCRAAQHLQLALTMYQDIARGDK